nr:septal ring lytic transglycosylase RlpA family protein [Granulicella sp. dw_53]
MTGCHKGTKAKKQPPPPPVSSSRGSSSGSTTASRRPVPRCCAVENGETAHPAPQPQVKGKPIETQVGLASWYGPPYAGRKGADGTVYDQNAMTAAHLTLPMGTVVRVTNLSNDQSVVVKITDRGPFVQGRIIDLSLAAAKATGVYRAGVAKVRVEAFSSPAAVASASTAGPAKAVIPGGRWCVQIGAFMNQEDAISLKNDLIRRYKTAKVIEFAGPTGHWVRINPKFPDKGTAEQVAESIHVPDAEPYLIRMD